MKITWPLFLKLIALMIISGTIIGVGITAYAEDESREPATVSRALKADPRLAKAKQVAAQGKYAEASRLLFPLARNPEFKMDSAQIKYIMGMMLYEMKLYQTAAFVFYDIIKQESQASKRKSRYFRMALEKLSLAGDALESDVVLKYAIKQIKEDEFPPEHRDMLYFRLGELRMADKDFSAASQYFARVQPSSPLFSKAKYNQALSLTQNGELDKAILVFDKLSGYRESFGVTDPTRVNALLGKARVLYQKQDWPAAIDLYRQVPRDTPQWHESLFEMTWALLRSSAFRSSLSNFQTLHSDFYSDYYQPESLLLRAIVYIFICRYQEMNKVIGLFNRIYGPVRKDVVGLLQEEKNPFVYYKKLLQASSRISQQNSSSSSAPMTPLNQSRNNGFDYNIPLLVARKILNEGDVSRSLSYIRHLVAEKKRIESTPVVWSRSGIGRYAKRVVEKRIQAAQEYTGRLVQQHLFGIASELRDINEQIGFLTLEEIKGKKETVKKELAGKSLVTRSQQIDDEKSRNFYIQNGYNYWPVKSKETWRNELGNYHFVGVQACE